MPNLLLKGNRLCCALFTIVMMCLDHESLLDTKELEALNLLYYSPLMMELESCLDMQSWVNREHRRGLNKHP